MVSSKKFSELVTEEHYVFGNSFKKSTIGWLTDGEIGQWNSSDLKIR